jgi:hypothetical protein
MPFYKIKIHSAEIIRVNTYLMHIDEGKSMHYMETMGTVLDYRFP